MHVSICIWKVRTYYLDQFPQQEGKVSFLPAKHGSTELLALQWPYLSDVYTCMTNIN